MRNSLSAAVAMGIFALVSARIGLKSGQAQPPTGQPFSPVIPERGTTRRSPHLKCRWLTPWA
jgi:hypothetical protein